MKLCEKHQEQNTGSADKCPECQALDWYKMVRERDEAIVFLIKQVVDPKLLELIGKHRFELFK